MQEFNQLFGEIRLESVIILAVALNFIWEVAKKIWRAITNTHDKTQDLEASMAKIEAYEKRIEAQDIKLEALVEASLAMLRHMLYSECERLIAKGEITVQELEGVKRLYTPYERLNDSDDTAKKLYKDVTKLPLKKH